MEPLYKFIPASLENLPERSGWYVYKEDIGVIHQLYWGCLFEEFE